MRTKEYQRMRLETARGVLCAMLTAPLGRKFSLDGIDVATPDDHADYAAQHADALLAELGIELDD